MKNYIIGGLLFLVVALVVGVEPVQRFVNEATNRGTLRGVETCLSYSESQLLSPEAVRSTCVATFQKPLYGNGHASGRAGPRMDQGTVAWGGILENKTPDHVTTLIQISIGIFDADGNEKEFTSETPIWIDPLDEAEFMVTLPDAEAGQFDNLEFCDFEDEAPKNCMSWGVTGVMGLTI